MNAPLNANIWDLVADRIAATPDRIAFTYEGRTLSYGAVGQLVEKLSAGLAEAGVNVDDKVIAKVGKSPESLALFLATVRIGAVYIPVNPAFGAHETGILIADAKARIFITDRADDGTLPNVIQLDDLKNATSAAPAVASGGPRACGMLYTSGTTGTPKGAVVSHRNMCMTFTACNNMWEIEASDRLLHVLPTYHAHGLFMATLCPLFAGAEIVLLPKFDIERVIALLPEATVLMTVPAILSRLSHHCSFTREACRNLRLVTSGSAPLAPELFSQILMKTGITVTDRYGSTEAGLVTANPVGKERKGSVGKPLPGVDVRLTTPEGEAIIGVGPGRIQVRSPHVFLGYWNRPELDGNGLQPGGWCDTGDIGQFDDDGYLFIVGRDIEMIISGGFNVYPREIEIALEECTGVAEAAVFGLPHPDFGEGVAAAVCPAENVKLSNQNLLKELEKRLASYKRPKAIFIRDALPKNDLGKVLKPRLVAEYKHAFEPSKN